MARLSVKRLVLLGSFTLASALTAAPGVARTASTGALLAWGSNLTGQLGNGTTQPSDVPLRVRLPKGTKVATTAGGGGYTLALTSTGSVLAWGENGSGQLGDGTFTASRRPVMVKLPKGIRVTAVSAGFYSSLALTSTGSVLAWGDGGYGELGDGTFNGSDVPVRVRLPKGTKVTAVAAGGYYSLALTSTGSVLAWGLNGNGQLGENGPAAVDVPVRVKLPRGTVATAIAGGGATGYALTSAGSVLAWGDNYFGELGNGARASCAHHTQCNLPVRVELPRHTRVTAISGGGYHALALTSTGSVLAWGEGQNGQLGDASARTRAVPVKVKLPKNTRATEVAAGAVHSLALTSHGTLLAWGSNADGELGNGNVSDRDVPVRVKLPNGAFATAVEAGPGAYFSLAVLRLR